MSMSGSKLMAPNWWAFLCSLKFPTSSTIVSKPSLIVVQSVVVVPPVATMVSIFLGQT